MRAPHKNARRVSVSAFLSPAVLSGPQSSVRANSSSSSDIGNRGTAATPEFHSYGATTNGLRWSKTVLGAESSGRFTTEYENMLGQSVRTERSGCNGATVVSTAAYDSHGHLVSAAEPGAPAVSNVFDALGEQVATIQTVGSEWRKSSFGSAYALIDGEIWRTSVSTQSCSDASIAPLVASSREQVTGLTAAQPSRSLSADVRGNVTETWTTFDAATGETISHRRVPTASNVALGVSRDGQQLKSVSVSAVTNTAAYDGLGRQIARTDGRGNTTTTAYDSFGQAVSVTDAAGAVTRYAYDPFGQLVAVTNALGNTIVYEYDLRGNKTYEGGATYPVTYAYDLFNVMTNMTTYRAEPTNNAALTGSAQTSGQAPGDVTTWLYDAATGVLTNKVYADGHGPSYAYTDTGRLATRTWARGIVTAYAYDGWGNLTNTAYSDSTPSVSLSYNLLGLQTSAADAAGTTTFAYDAFGAPTNETVVGVAGTNVVERFLDAFDRDFGYAVNDERRTTLAYDPATGRLASMVAAGNTNAFTWAYLPGTELKQTVAYPNGLTVNYAYETNRDLLTQVRNASGNTVISQYDYANDALGRRTQMGYGGTAFSGTDIVAYGYNARSEVTNALAATDLAYRYAYAFDDIGNRSTAVERGTNFAYSANSLNQYTGILGGLVPFSPEFDLDGNQTLIRTSTGVWTVTYNGENRPVSWTCGVTNIVMAFDRMGRRVVYDMSVSGSPAESKRFAYDGYLLVQESNLATSNRPQATSQSFVWDPTEPTATRPLCMMTGTNVFIHTHDLTKNVCELLSPAGTVVTAYDYSPFGEVSRSGADVGNHFQWSSECFDPELMLVYYNYRHYNLMDGRWISRDPMEEELPCYGYGSSIITADYLGLKVIKPNDDGKCPKKCCGGTMVQLVPIWHCTRKLGGVGPTRLPIINHQYVCCAGENVRCYGVQKYRPSCMKRCEGIKSQIRRKKCEKGCLAKKGDIIEPEVSRSGTCEKRCVSPSEKTAVCTGCARMPEDYAIGPGGIDCQEWADGATSSGCK